jgi:transposase
MEQVVIGVDPHKLSATIEVVDHQERLLGSGRFDTDRAGYTAMRTYARAWPARVWAVEGANGAGRSLAQRLLEAGEVVLDVPAKLAAGSGCSTPGTTVRPTPMMRTRSRPSRCAPRRCGC